MCTVPCRLGSWDAIRCETETAFAMAANWISLFSESRSVQIIPVHTFPGSLPYFTPISCPPPVLLFLPGNSRNLYGPKLVIWIITSIFYSKVVQLPGPVWNSSLHTIDTIHISKHLWPQPGNLQPSCAVDFCAGKVRSSISGRNGRRRVGGDVCTYVLPPIKFPNVDRYGSDAMNCLQTMLNEHSRSLRIKSM